MFDKVSRLAERATVGLSRRALFTQIGRIGLGALAFATFVGEAAASGTARWILNGGCCGGANPYLLQEKVRSNWVNVGCTTYGQLVVVFCPASPNCCAGTGYCGGDGTVCYSDSRCTTPC
jgi:hypothetical protein